MLCENGVHDRLEVGGGEGGGVSSGSKCQSCMMMILGKWWIGSNSSNLHSHQIISFEFYNYCKFVHTHKTL